ncbi:MAG TPA: hypothetical protein PLR88_01680 [Bacteroidales bacterium]|nr:hypothetical protein [Bacteroidales bacterium]
MKRDRLFRSANKLNAKSFMILPVLLYAEMLFAQDPANFSGEWALDKLKSNAGEGIFFAKDNEEILDIDQDSVFITICNTIRQKEKDDITVVDRYNLDGKESTLLNDSRPIITVTRWSENNKLLTIITSMTSDDSEYVREDTYSLSDNRKTLTIHSFYRDPHGNKNIIKVYRKR